MFQQIHTIESILANQRMYYPDATKERITPNIRANVQRPSKTQLLKSRKPLNRFQAALAYF